MSTTHNDLEQMQKLAASFVAEREWNQFHNPKNLSMAIAVEAAELMELFMWCTTEASQEVLKERQKEVEDEFADVLIGLLCFANVAQLDIQKAFIQKLEKTKRKYPVEIVRGKSDKYTRYLELKKESKD